MAIIEYIKRYNKIKHLKWVEIIHKESDATKRSTMYILEKDNQMCELILIDDVGNKRKAGGEVLSKMLPKLEGYFAKIDGSNIADEFKVAWRDLLNVYTKGEVDDALTTEKSERQSAYDLINEKVSQIDVLLQQIATWKRQMTSTDEDTIVNTVVELVELFKSIPEDADIGELINQKISVESVVDHLSSISSNVPLSANQGRVLKGLIDQLNSEKTPEPTQNGNWVRRFLDGVKSWVSADDFGKNIGNADLIVPAGTVREFDLTGARLKLKGLENKSTDPSVNLKLKVDAQGNLFVSDTADVTFNLPDNFNITATVNHLYPTPVPETPDYQQEVANLLNQIKSLSLKPLLRRDFNLWTFENKGIELQKFNEDGSFFITNNVPEFREHLTQKSVSLFSNVPLPHDRNWVLRISGNILDYHNGQSVFIGVSRGDGSAIFSGIKTREYSGIELIGNRSSRLEARWGLNIYLLKSELFLSTLVYQGGKLVYTTQNAFPELGNYFPQVDLFNYYIGANVSMHMAYAII